MRRPREKGDQDTMAKKAYHGGTLISGDRWTLDGHVFVSDQDSKEDMLMYAAMPPEALEALIAEAKAAEEAAYQALKDSASGLDDAIALVQVLAAAKRYVSVPKTQHTGNHIVGLYFPRGTYERSNQTYVMQWRFETIDKYDRELQERVVTGYRVDWCVRARPHDGPGAWCAKSVIAEQRGKKFETLEAAQKYIDGRVKAYAHLFVEDCPPVPRECAYIFTSGGALLPGYRLEGGGEYVA
jgi:hypothetical protein